MVDEYRFAVLRGFDIAVGDIGDELHLCHPLLSLEGDPTLYVARRLNWQNDRKALAVSDPSEASDLGTLLPDTHKHAIASGEAVIAVGTGFVQAAEAAGVLLDSSEMVFARVHDAQCRISVATPASFAKLKTRLANEARTAFDEELGDAARRGRHLSERGNAALLLMRRCGPRRRDDLAIRQLAGARQNRELDLYRRLLIRFALELGTQENDLDRRAERHIALASTPLLYTTLELSQVQKYDDLSKLPIGDTMASLIYTNSNIIRGTRRLERDIEKFLYDRTCLPSHKVSTSKFSPHVMNWKEYLDQRLPVPGGIRSEWHIYKHPNAGLSPPMGESKPPVTARLHSSDFGEGVQRNSEDVRLMSVQSKKLPSRTSLFTSNPQSRILTEESKKVPIRKARDRFHILTLPVSGKSVVDNVDYREAV